MSELMKEALEAIEGEVKTVPNKMPDGATLVGIRLARDESRSGRFMEAVDRRWQTTGIAVAIRDGHVIAGNALFGRFTNGAPKVSAMHWVICPKCGCRCEMPLAVWEAKDLARRQGVEIGKDESGKSTLDRYGSCKCGGKWRIDDSGEKEDLERFTREVLKAFSHMEAVPPLLGPRAFTVGKDGDVGQPWSWLKEAMARVGKTVAPFDKSAGADTLIYNPGFWLGYVDNHDMTGMFWVEDGKTKRPIRFNPSGVEGL